MQALKIYNDCRYIEEHVLKTGVAIETQGFAFITSGKKRESLTVSYYAATINNSIIKNLELKFQIYS